ncbi:class I SAM-dependent methyltransferase [Sulfitobacter guttiformis]|uniref:S-adenosylmethionine-dependent methyltransferase n=1 Tax=Sulfitobacter guttiformis TaxID=74349 RepID=A0A420DTL2_9RHOB|nr:class I SAM-dependent methyltransferase [Sulfitobacter guttiformis]KIN71190.1 hypothetical protein Z949_348 [Sulfitobacter guttiformis KCTC 32187]RKE97661.1 S-adenosylmethionine-dependent methyltransferase [Sulfitobacter guttiformis]
MTRLDLFIGRMVSQRACIDRAIALTQGMTEPVFELGLGNGRTFDHIRANVHDRPLYVFERTVASHPSSTPSDEQLVLGDIFETLPALLERTGKKASFIHADLGGHNPAKNDEFARTISPLIEGALAPGGIMVASDAMYFDGLTELPLPEGAFVDRAFIYQKPA